MKKLFIAVLVPILGANMGALGGCTGTDPHDARQAAATERGAGVSGDAGQAQTQSGTGASGTGDRRSTRELGRIPPPSAPGTGIYNDNSATGDGTRTVQ